MDSIAYAASYGLVCLAVLSSIVLCFCLWSPVDQTETPKNPVKLLIILKVASNIFLQISILVYFFCTLSPQFFKLKYVTVYISSFFLNSCMASSLWLSIFYYTRIVPVQRAFLVWIKKNIKTLTYCSLAVQNFVMLAVDALYFLQQCLEMGKNFTGNPNCTSQGWTDKLNVSSQTFDVSNLLLYVVLMVLSWGATLAYLCRHMKRSRNSFSSSQLRVQLRVTIMGIVQTALTVFFLIFSLLYEFCFWWSDPDFVALQTVFCFFSFGITLNLGLGQPLFRKRAADLFHRVHQSVAKTCSAVNI